MRGIKSQSLLHTYLKLHQISQSNRRRKSGEQKDCAVITRNASASPIASTWSDGGEKNGGASIVVLVQPRFLRADGEEGKARERDE